MGGAEDLDTRSRARAVDIRIGKTRVVANPRCTERGAAPFDPTLIVEA